MFRTIGVATLLITIASAAASQEQPGRAIFEGKGNCWTCHGKDAKGGPLAPDLTDGEWLNVDGTAAAVRALIQKGVPQPKKHPAPMPPMGGASLSPEELDAVTAYVLSLAAGQATTERRLDGHSRESLRSRPTPDSGPAHRRCPASRR